MTEPGKTEHRDPYVGEGADGARRSAEIDRAEADTYRTGSPNHSRCLASAERWERQAEEIEARERQVAERAADDEQHAAVIERGRGKAGAADDLIARIMTASLSQTFDATNVVIDALTRRAERAEAALHIVRTEIRVELGGPYMPMPHVLLGRLYPSDEQIQREIDHRKAEES